MITINNKFSVDEECYTYVRDKQLEYNCPVCKGAKKILFNNYWIPCKQCNANGKLVSDQTVVIPQKIKIQKIVATIWQDNTITLKYKTESSGSTIVKNRPEKSLFKTLEECKAKCKEINTGVTTGMF